MIRVVVNGRAGGFPVGTTLLEACRRLGFDVPTLCHDPRLHPTGGCRICVVGIRGWDRLATACNTTVAEGMEVETHSDAVVAARRTLLGLLARGYPADAVVADPDQPFHRLLASHGVTPGDGGSPAPPQFHDGTHPYLHADLDRCITCHRCVRICEEVQGQSVWRAWNRGDATRIRPVQGDTLLESGCVSCGACADTCPTGAIADRSVVERGAPGHWTRTTCPYCGVGCEMEAGTRAGRIVQVRPVLDAPVNKGHLCVKGRYAFGFVEATDRITHPMVREDGRWRTVGWDEAVRFVATRLARIRDTAGPDAIGMLGSARGTNEENYLAQKFARVVLGTHNVDCCARVCHAPSAAGLRRSLGTGAATNSFDDIERAAGFLLCGCNPTEAHPVVGARIRQAVLRGARLVVVDPRETELARIATVHLRPRPGTNVPLLNALAHVVLGEGLADDAFLEGRAEGLDAFRAFVADWTPARAEALCGVPAGLIREAARVYAASGPAMCFHGLGTTEHVQGTDAVQCLANLALLTGNLGRPGAGVNPLRGQNNVQGSAHMGCDPSYLTGYVPVDQARAGFEAAWGTPLPRSPGLNLMQMLDAAGEGRLRALWAIGYDVALTNPDAATTRAALARLELVVVQDLFPTALAREFGTVFLPACSSFEKDGTFMNSERRVQRVRRVLPPAGGSKPDWEILCTVAAAMGAGDAFAFRSAEAVWDEVRSVWKAGAGMSYARLDAGGLQWPCPDESHPGTPVLHADSFPSGPRARLACIGHVPSAEATDGAFPFLLTTGRSLYQFNAGTMTARTPNAVLRPTDTLDMAPVDASRLGLVDGEAVRVRSRHGEATLPLRVDPRVAPGQLFATFHAAQVFLNRLTGPGRDAVTSTPEYKVVAVSVERVSDAPARAGT